MDFYFKNKVQNFTYEQLHPQDILNAWQEKNMKWLLVKHWGR